MSSLSTLLARLIVRLDLHTIDLPEQQADWSDIDPEDSPFSPSMARELERIETGESKGPSIFTACLVMLLLSPVLLAEKIARWIRR